MSEQTLAPQAPIDQFKAGQMLYEASKPAGEVDLVPTVRGIFTKVGVPDETLAGTYDKNRHVKAALGRVATVQRTQINRFLELALISSHESTTGMRSELLPNGSVDKWLGFVESTVAPFIADKKLLG